ncbi:MAG: beta-Ala-His dipeptidase, partial [Candidatus Accumulibacter sp.]|nr:beta-Ala-His dipeptidase [Accumulibacter sp.]
MDSILSPIFGDLQPAAVWRHFAAICAIPHPSKGEARLREHLRAWAAGRGLAATVDAAGNMVVRKPASAGREGAPGVVLQAHLDMVCQANAGVAHDFARDAIEPVLRDGWIVAERTTLGADNGIGVALILAALEDESLEHGPLEALFTVDEETGMGGARGLAPDALQGRLMLNLDTEDWGRFFLGCAGGVDVSARRAGRPEPTPGDWTALRIEARGLVGGHSGIDIHRGRGSAIKLLVRALRAIEREGTPLRLASLRGGSARNALPREAEAVVALPRGAEEGIAGRLAALQDVFRAELAGADEEIALVCAPAEAARTMARAEHAAWLGALHAAPQGVRRMSVRAPGVVETSANLGIVDLTPDNGECRFMVRSLIDSAGAEFAEEIVSLFALAGIGAEASGHYPGWQPNPDSPLLALCRRVYRGLYGAEPATEVVHAGLECGIVGGKIP